jgi:tetratricopeptide (TPR) repeat protein
VIGAKAAPHEGYWNCFGTYLEGDFRTAAKEFRDAARDGIFNVDHVVGGPWIDSICYHTMLGECAYQMGDLTTALDQYTAALNRFLLNRNWMLRIDFAPGLTPEQNIKTIVTWGTSSRRIAIGDFPERYPSFRGRMDNAAVLKTGGVIAAPSFHPVYVTEIVRCTALAMSRRRELLGPTCEHDPLTGQLIDALVRRPGPPNHWSQCWIELQLGLAYASANNLPQAINELTKSLLAQDRYDHPLTCVALLELGRLAMEQGKYDVAINFFHDATISAAYFDLYVVMEEGFRLGAECHLIAGQKGVYSPLAPAIAATQKVRMLQVSLMASLADQLLAAGDLAGAVQAIGQARGTMGRREMGQGAIGSRLNFQAARASMAAGEGKPGAASLLAAITYQKAASPRLFQIGLADAMLRGGAASERILDGIFDIVLREPTLQDWIHDPLDTLALLSTPHPLPYEHWLELALARRDSDKALNIAERIRRHRFYATQPLGGRLLALRWVLEGPSDSLSQLAMSQRHELLVKYPKYGELSRRAGELREKLHSLPVALSEAEAKQQQEVLTELGRVSAAQELALQIMSLDRVPSELAFPPLRETKEIQQALPAGTLVFSYLATSRNVYGFALSRDRYGYFKLPQPAKVKADVTEMLRLMGHTDRTQPVAASDLAANGWHAAAERLVKQLTDNSKPEEWSKYDEVVIVPDGVLWYLPFEALPIDASTGSSLPMIMQLPVRYAPTLALAVPAGRGQRPSPRTAVVPGKLLPRDDDAFTKASLDAIVNASGDVAVLRKTLAAPSAVLSTAFDRLIVLADGDDVEHAPLAWSPLVADHGKPGGTLADWLQLPFGGPEQMILPGFHTPAEHGLKKGGTGDEVFLTLCGLMGSGCRTVLLSRWRVGGQSSVDLLREFVQEMPHEPAANAWRRSVQLTADRPLDPAAEGRLRASAGAATVAGLKADHPFFWSGYLLADRGRLPAEEEDQPEAKAKVAGGK